jgi:hypothetical protein
MFAVIERATEAKNTQRVTNELYLLQLFCDVYEVPSNITPTETTQLFIIITDEQSTVA